MSLDLLDTRTESALRSLCADPPASPEALRLSIDAYLEAVRTAGARDPFVDQETAEWVHRGCVALLTLWPDLNPRHRALVTGACRYFVQTDDGEDDLGSLVGFDDDAEVVTHVLRQLDRVDLMPPAPGSTP